FGSEQLEAGRVVVAGQRAAVDQLNRAPHCDRPRYLADLQRDWDRDVLEAIRLEHEAVDSRRNQWKPMNSGFIGHSTALEPSLGVAQPGVGVRDNGARRVS